MTKEKMTVDELLARQDSGSNLVTVESTKDDPDSVKITPWTPDGGCLCHLAVTVAKNSIESVETTDQRHYCCDKVLTVVEIHFKKDASISLTDLFQQTASRAGSHHKGEPQRPFDLSSRPELQMGLGSAFQSSYGVGGISPSYGVGGISPSLPIPPPIPGCQTDTSTLTQGPDPNCYPNCFNNCTSPCYQRCLESSSTLEQLERCIRGCQVSCQHACQLHCKVTCTPCQVDETFHSTQQCSQLGNTWRRRCRVPGPCERDPLGICSNGYRRFCCDHSFDGVVYHIRCGHKCCDPSAPMPTDC